MTRGAAQPRVLWLASNGPRWTGDSSAPFILNLAIDLRARGWDVELLLPQSAGLSTVDCIDGVPVTRFHYAWPRRFERLCYGAGVLAHLRGKPRDLALVPGFILAQWLALRRRVASGGISLVHAHWLLPQGFVALQVARFSGLPLVATAHGSDLLALSDGLSLAAKRRVLAGADAITVNSSVTEAAARGVGIDIAHLHRIPMGATAAAPDATKAAALRSRLRRGSGPLVGFVGRLVTEKGIDELLRAVARLRDLLPDIRLLLVGDGPERARFEALAGELGLADEVVFAGAVSPPEVGAYLQAIDVFVGPSRRSREGGVEAQGLVFAEAMLAGVPIVATSSGGITDLVIDGQTGLLVPEANPQAIADAVLRICRDPVLATRLAAGGKAHATHGYTRDVSADAFSRLYAEVLARRSKK